MANNSCDFSDAVAGVIGAGGDVTAILLFLSPVPTFLKIIRERSTMSFSIFPYLSGLWNCFLWSLYALPVITEDRLTPLICNSIGLGLQIAYLALFIAFCPKDQRRHTALLVLACAAPPFILGLSVLGIWSAPPNTYTYALGWLALLVNIAFYASPLRVVGLVIRTKSVEFMPLPMTVCCLLCSSFWTAYGGYVCDPFIAVPNAAGVVLGVAQCIIWTIYCRKRPTAAGYGVGHAALPETATKQSERRGSRNQVGMVDVML